MSLPNKYLKTEERKEGEKTVRRGGRWVVESAYVLEIQLVLWLIWCDVASEDMPAYDNGKSAE